MQGPWILTVEQTGKQYSLPDGTRVTVGRVKECEILVEDHVVSRRHCTIEARGAELIVTDLESANGTFVNERLIRSCSVRAGDEVRAGSTVLTVSGPETATPRKGSMLSTVGDDRLESVIRKRFEPSRFDWLAPASSDAETGAGDLGLLQRAQRHLALLHRVSETLATARDFDALAEATLAAILSVTGGERAAFVLRRGNLETDRAEIAAAKGRIPGVDRFTVSRTLVADVIGKGMSVFAHDAVNDDRFSGRESVFAQRVRSVMCVPLRTTDQVLGALYVDSLSVPGRFSEADLELLAALGNQAGVALHRVRLMGELERLLFDTIRAIAATIDAKDGYTHRHSERVATLSRRIASELGLTPEQQQTAQLAALLHDVGKIAVPDSILNKPERLTPDEFEEMKKHPLHGAQILANIQSPSVTAVLPGVQYHHERWDGAGYPEGLRGEEIPLLGRLLGIADYFDAVTSPRAYRAPIPPDAAIEMIQTEAGKHFDPRIADAVVQLYRRGELVPSDWEELVALGRPFGEDPSGADRE